MAKDTNLAAYYFHQGTNFSSYEYLGCNFKFENNRYLYSFRVWAPNALKVCLVSDFSGWDNEIVLSKITENGIWELIYTSDGSLEGFSYKYKIYSVRGVSFKGDPYAFYSKGGADGASIIYDRGNFTWTDAKWFNYRKKNFITKKGSYLPAPINIYELHIGSFIRTENNDYTTYRDLANFLPSYLKTMGYTHVEFLPIAEHPFDGSWGYQVCAFYAPTSRFGTPDDFKYLINTLHSVGIGVIIDWVPAHFPKDEWGLYEFDGQPLYEYQGNDRQESRSWGTRFFDLGRQEVQSFLISNALYFLREFHVDALRVDAVASMLYLDYDRTPDEWIPNTFGQNINLESVAFFHKLNSTVLGEFPDVLMIAEESGDYGTITTPVSLGGLGFTLKWNMGWANDFYDYLSTDPLFRKHKHKALNFPLMYAFTENYVMPISHDEVVHGKRSLIDKIHGSYQDKFSQMRAALLLFMTYPGKKLLFMGTEFAQFREWDYEHSLEWFMLEYPSHRQMREYVSSLNHFYLAHKELYERDFDEAGFKWIFPDENEKNLVAFRRRAISGKELIVVINFSGARQVLSLPVRNYDKLISVFSTDYIFDTNEFRIKKCGKEYFADISLPAFSGAVFQEKNNYQNIKI